MQVGTRRKNPRKISFLLDLFHIITGFCIVIMAVLCFLNPVRYELLFTLIFLLAAVLYITNGVHRLRESTTRRTSRLSGMLYFVLGILLLLLSIISAICYLGR